MKRWLILLLTQQNFAALPETVDFNDHVQPILSEYCYHCHGPDSSTRTPKANPLRLDREEFAFLLRENDKPVIIKGDPKNSELIKRISTKDQDDIMPTPESHKPPLKPEQIALLSKWIEQGAPYEEHWSFLKPTRPELPDSKWGNNAIDRFIGSKHKEHKLIANNPEETHRLIRRISFDVTGLPPTAEQISSFQEAAASDLGTAVQLAVSEMLGTDAYAEHFGRHWLDAARYADTHGIHIDNYRLIWPYRDWVIDSFKKNQSFKDFTIEQLAGDLLPKPSLDQIVATGFNRCLPTTGEGGAISEEYAAIYAKDQAETTSAIWLGLTAGCAACHDHKFDPISQKDFYALTAFFRNTTMAPMDRNAADHPPNIFVPRREDRAQWEQVKVDIKTSEQEIQKRKKSAAPDEAAWLAALTPVQIESLADYPDFSLPLTVTEGQLDLGDRQLPFTKATVPGDLGPAPQLKGLNLELGDFASFEARDQVTFGGYLWLDGKSNGAVISRMDSGQDFRGWDIWLEDSRIGSHIIDKWPTKAVKAMTKDALPHKKWLHVMITYDGKAEPKKSLTVYVDGKISPINYTHSGKVDSLATSVPLRLGGRHPNTPFNGSGAFRDFSLYKRVLTATEVQQAASKSGINQLLSLPAEERNDQQKRAIANYFLAHVDPITRDLNKQLTERQGRQAKLKKAGSVTLVMKEKKEPAFAHILDRGEYSLKKEKVDAAIPELFKDDASPGVQSRKQLAEWLVSENNPLTARVTVNRIWYYFFGRGLVETTEDFGIMGARPTHPELLDWLAVEFMESDWDTHHIIKLITSSATYQQSGNVTSNHREKDPTNLYLAHHPRPRLEAEQIRDLALSASGLLVAKVGGPSVKPYQPGGIWEAVAMKSSTTRHYKQDKGESLYRRSLYTFWKRTAMNPAMEILNAPTRETFCVRRDVTNTPLQAFVTLNDPQFVEATRNLATIALRESESFDHRLDAITQKFLSRIFENDEREIVRQTLSKVMSNYKTNPELAKSLIAVGESPVDENLDPVDLASWTVIASQIFNLDETLTK
ncbi:DUF1553 domain-containing protein [Akkermansiaceae bacterium]|nr:DUF1553 domain-containing protein [Akkermansiaceae bacterium]